MPEFCHVLTLEGHANSVRSCAWSPDGRRIVSGSNDNTLRVWDAASGQTVLTLEGHANGVRSCAWSPDGRRIVSGSYDNTLRVWDADMGTCLYRIVHLPEGELARLNGEGTEVLGASKGGWRYLEWVSGDTLEAIRVLPAEYFGPLPSDE